MNIGVFWRFFLSFLCACKAFVSNKSLSSVPLNQAPVSGCRHFSCVLIIHVCLCVCASVCAWKQKWMYIVTSNKQWSGNFLDTWQNAIRISKTNISCLAFYICVEMYIYMWIYVFMCDKTYLCTYVYMYTYLVHLCHIHVHICTCVNVTTYSTAHTNNSMFHDKHVSYKVMIFERVKWCKPMPKIHAKLLYDALALLNNEGKQVAPQGR